MNTAMGSGVAVGSGVDAGVGACAVVAAGAEPGARSVAAEPAFEVNACVGSAKDEPVLGPAGVGWLQPAAKRKEATMTRARPRGRCNRRDARLSDITAYLTRRDITQGQVGACGSMAPTANRHLVAVIALSTTPALAWNGAHQG